MSVAFEYFEIAINPPTGQVWRHTTGALDRVVDGQRYTTIVSERGSYGPAGINSQSAEFEVRLPCDHAYIRRYCQQANPPTVSRVTWWRVTDGVTKRVWRGNVSSIAIEDKIATLHIPADFTQTILRTIPHRTAGRECPLLLYGDECGVDREGSHNGLAHKVTIAVSNVTGRVVRLDLGTTDRNGGWALHGEIVHPASGERRTIVDFTDLSPGTSSIVDLTMTSAIPELRTGHTVQVFAGCDHTISGDHGCGPKFGNRQAFRGFNRMNRSTNSRNIWNPTHLGIRSLGEM